jgi:hypothetical protein
VKYYDPAGVDFIPFWAKHLKLLEQKFMEIV